MGSRWQCMPVFKAVTFTDELLFCIYVNYVWQASHKHCTLQSLLIPSGALTESPFNTKRPDTLHVLHADQSPVAYGILSQYNCFGGSKCCSPPQSDQWHHWTAVPLPVMAAKLIRWRQALHSVTIQSIILLYGWTAICVTTISHVWWLAKIRYKLIVTVEKWSNPEVQYYLFNDSYWRWQKSSFPDNYDFKWTFSPSIPSYKLSSGSLNLVFSISLWPFCSCVLLKSGLSGPHISSCTSLWFVQYRDWSLSAPLYTCTWMQLFICFKNLRFANSLVYKCHLIAHMHVDPLCGSSKSRREQMLRLKFAHSGVLAPVAHSQR